MSGLPENMYTQFTSLYLAKSLDHALHSYVATTNRDRLCMQQLYLILRSPLVTSLEGAGYHQHRFDGSQTPVIVVLL